MILLQHGETLAGGDGNLSPGGFQVAGQDFQKSRLSRPVGADDTIAVALGKFDVHIFK